MISHAAAALRATTRSTKTHRGAASTIHTNSGMPTAAVSRRLPKLTDRPGNSSAVTATTPPTSHPTEAPLAAMKVRDRAIQLQRAEIGPQRRRDPQLGVRDLPQEEVRDPHLAARANEQIGIRNPTGVEGAADVGLRDVLGIQLARADLAGEHAKRVEQLVASAIVEGEHQVEP